MLKIRLEVGPDLITDLFRQEMLPDQQIPSDALAHLPQRHPLSRNRPAQRQNFFGEVRFISNLTVQQERRSFQKDNRF
jgi:hypothetical protein